MGRFVSQRGKPILERVPRGLIAGRGRVSAEALSPALRPQHFQRAECYLERLTGQRLDALATLRVAAEPFVFGFVAKDLRPDAAARLGHEREHLLELVHVRTLVEVLAV